MKRTKSFLTICLIFFSQPGYAFQEQRTGDILVPQKSEKQAEPKSLQPRTEISSDKPLNSSEGTEVFIPGLGKLGMLPKMDFGLELLYGSKADKQPSQPVDDLNSSDNLRIRGTLKHNF